MTSLQNAKNNLAQVGGFLSRAKKENPEYADLINSILVNLKGVNSKINDMISGNIGVDFSFDEDVSAPAKSKRMKENYGGVDLGDFENMINPTQDDGEWKKVFESTKDFSGVSMKGIDFDQELTDGISFVDRT